MLSPRERLLKTLKGEPVDRPPVICTGGMMNAAIADVVTQSGCHLPDAHNDHTLMSQLAVDICKSTGFENLGVPFCMTIEAEVLGSNVNLGSLTCEPKIGLEAFASTSCFDPRPIEEMLSSGRVGTVTRTVRHLSHAHPDLPVVGNLSGPISTAASVVQPAVFLKDLYRDRPNAHLVLSHISDLLIAYAELLIAAGCALISVGDPTATGQILGPKLFEEYALRYINKTVDGIHALGSPVVVHICGDMNKVRSQIPMIRSDAISTDAAVSLRSLKQEFPQLITMGNLSTFLLEQGTPGTITSRVARLMQDGVDIISPACGLSTSTSLANIRAMTAAVRSA